MATISPAEKRARKDKLIKDEIANLAQLFKDKLPRRNYEVHTTLAMSAGDRYTHVRQLVQSSSLFSRKVINTFSGDQDLSAKRNIVFKFVTPSSREDLLQQIIVALGSRAKKIVIPHPKSSIGGVVINVSDPTIQTTVPFHILVKYNNPNAFRNLRYTNPLLEARKWHRKHSNRTPDTSHEHYILRTINDKIYELGDHVPVTLHLGRKFYEDFIGFIPGKSGSHADFVGLNKDLEEVCFISHKQGSTAKDFQQYSGITSRAGKISTHTEVEDFKKAIVDSKTIEDFRRMAYYRHIKDNKLKGMAVFGEDYGSYREGMNNVTYFSQGNVKVRRQGRRSKATDQVTIQIIFSTSNLPQSSLGSLTYRGYKPTLGARRGESTRKIEHGNKTLNGVRGGVYSESYIVTNRTSEEI